MAALVPEVGPLRGLTVSRLTALNSGIVRAFIPGTERQQVLDKLRRWNVEIGELALGDDDHDPTVSVVLTGVDTGPILDVARQVDSEGERRRRVRELLSEALEVKDSTGSFPWTEMLWRGTRRRVDLVFANVRDRVELPSEMLRAGSDPKVVLDFPWDVDGHSPSDDRGRVHEFWDEHGPEWTAAWLPNFLTQSARDQLGLLVRLEWLLTGDTFERYASYLAPSDRAIARTQLANQLHAARDRVLAVPGTTRRRAGGPDQQNADGSGGAPRGGVRPFCGHLRPGRGGSLE